MRQDLRQDAARAVSNMALTVLNSEARITMFRNCLVRDIMKYTVPAQGILDDAAFRAAVFPLAVKEGEVQDVVNPIWGHASFILPAVVALARLYDGILSPVGKPTFDMLTRDDPDSLYGVVLDGISPSGDCERGRFATMIAGAAKSYLTDIDQCHLARWALSEYRTPVEGSA